MDTLKSISLVSLIAVLGACSSTQETRTPKESIAFSAVKTKTSYELVCKPLNSIVVQDASWVEKCNSTAYEFLTSETKNGVKFKKEINQEPFGQAAKFAAFLLQRNPQNFEVVSLEQKYDFVSNKT